MAQISYTNKVALNENPEILDINKVTDDDMNEIKQVVNDNYNNTIQITDTEPTDSDNKLWIDTGEVGSQASEITNEYSTSIGLGYSANYVNNLHTYSTTEQRVGTWIDGKPLYRCVITTTTAAAGTEKRTDISNLNVDKLILNGFINTGSLGLPLNAYISSSNYIITYQNITSNEIRTTVTDSSYANKELVYILEYTKTTD